ncbi:MAG: DUF885 family protein [Erysipelotrichaceae bacterium]|nr:DUF885 family protein [Erysipelotrichaceae bacterium]
MKKITVLLLSLVLVLAGCSEENYTTVTDEEIEKVQVDVTVYERTGSDFEKWCDEYFKESMEKDFMTQHFNVVDYEALGQKKGELDWGTISYEHYEEMLKETKEDLATLNSFDYESLSDCEKVYYDNLKHGFEVAIVCYENPNMEWYFMPGSPMNDNLITNMNEFVFRSVEDVEDYLVMLADMDRYLLEAVDFTEQQAAKGYFIQDGACDQTIEMLTDFSDKVDDNALIVGFNHKMEQLDFDTDDYKAQNEKIIKEEIIPAWEEAAQRLAALKGTCSEDQLTFASFEGGAEYYEALLKNKSSSYYSLDEMWEFLLDYLEAADNDFLAVVESKDGEKAIKEYAGYTWNSMKPLDALEYHENHMYKYVPYAKDVTYTATYLDESIANDSVIAYYVPPCIDAIEDNVIKVNPHNAGDDDMETLYTTMSHEGFPGHLYQFNYFYNSNPHPISTCYNMIGYSEGWAMHSELYCLDWLGYKNEGTKVITKYQDVILDYVLSAIVDIAIQYKGWTPEAVAEFMGTVYGQEVSAEQIEGMYYYYAYRPGMMIPYGFGLAQMETMMRQAKEALGDKYSDVEFNGVILNYGPRAYESIQKDVEAYIASKAE